MTKLPERHCRSGAPMSNDLVYLVCLGEYGEGHKPVAAFSSWQGANADARNRCGVTAPFTESGEGKWVSRIGGANEVWIVRLPIDGAPDVPHKVQIRPRGDCPISTCRKDVALLRDNTTRVHTMPDGQRCRGGYGTPKAVRP